MTIQQAILASLILFSHCLPAAPDSLESDLSSQIQKIQNEHVQLGKLLNQVRTTLPPSQAFSLYLDLLEHESNEGVREQLLSGCAYLVLSKEFDLNAADPSLLHRISELLVSRRTRVDDIAESIVSAGALSVSETDSSNTLPSNVYNAMFEVRDTKEAVALNAALSRAIVHRMASQHLRDLVAKKEKGEVKK